ncbi:MAG TPA: serine hydrolase domain-containing protein [Anaerolineae bacterium]|nr:serine hydrolase domain-containing protein [Anaerolineae bacterium]HQI85685.1 serine hydrolase domain-containing protein [Anaerolineae bacterium]
MDNTVIENIGFSPARLGRISTLMQRYVDEGKLAGIIATVARRGQTVYLEKFGMMDIEAHKPMQFDAIFRIASMTKPITSVAIMMLYEEGHFHLNTPIANFIPGFKDTKVFARETDDGIEVADLDRPITFRHLFTHTAGLSYGWNENDPVDRQYQKAQRESGLDPAKMTVKDLVEVLTTLPLAFQPGTKWRYSYAIDVLGYIIEVISGKPLDVFLKERLFEPLGMVDTDFYVPVDKADRLCALYGHPNNASTLQRIESPMHAHIFEKPSFLSGGGGLVSTVHDYARFAQMLANGGELDGTRILSPTTVALYSLNHMPEAALPYGFAEGEDLYHWGYGYSLGTRVLMDVSKSGIAGSVGEFGWDGAFSTYVWVDPKEAFYGLMMLQHAPNAYYPIAQQFKQLTYQAIVR